MAPTVLSNDAASRRTGIHVLESMENPYRAPASTSLSSPPTFHWMRVVGWSWLIFAAANLVAVISGLSMAKWEIYGATIDEAIANVRLIQRIGIGVVAVMLYWRFAAGVTSRPLLHVLALFALVQLIDHAFSLLVYAVPLRELFDVSAIGRGALAAMIGAGIAWVSSGRLSRAKPLRDPA